ncbi:MAG: hypothetical protein IKJ99_09725 [Oscillospiraceae bacterium]|nr:hypothetical protein [Oscillospiraceae bacterium]
MAKKKDDAQYRDDPNLKVLTPTELKNVESLSQRQELLTENRCAVFMHNLDYLCRTQGIKQARLCDDMLGGLVYPSQLSGYKKKGNDIPLRTMVLIASVFGYTVEEMCGKLLDREEDIIPQPDKHPPRPFDEYQAIIGTYEFAYFTDNQNSGVKLRTAAAHLGKGMLTIYMRTAVDGVPIVRAEAFLDCTPEELDRLTAQLQDAEAKGGGRGYVCVYENAAETCMHRYFSGDVLLTAANVIIKLQQQRGNDELTITLRNRAGVSNNHERYRSGLGTLSHSSTGDSQTPSVQAVALSSKGFSRISREELAEYLLMTPAKVEIGDEVKQIISYINRILTHDQDSLISVISEEEKQHLIENEVKHILSQILKRSVCIRYAVTAEQDFKVYVACCNT